MSAKCKYGDEESVEVVPCTYDQSTGAVSCPKPHKRGHHVRLKPLALIIIVRISIFFSAETKSL